MPTFYVVDAHSNSEFAEALRSFRVERTAEFNSLRHILIVADNDECPSGRFANVCNQIDRVFGAGTAPTAPLQPTGRTATRPQAITVLMVPWKDQNGHLERMCVEAARDANKNVAAHVDTFMNLVHAENWKNESRFGKAWLRTNIAVRCFIPLGRVFNDARHHALIPVEHSSFDAITDVLRNL